MNRPDPIDVLNRLLEILVRSLPAYLEDTSWRTRRGSERILDTLARIASEQRELAAKVTGAVRHEGGNPEPGQFPMAFTAINDLSLEFLVKRAVEDQNRDLEAVGRAIDDLAEIPRLRLLADEVLAAAREHLRMLEELAADDLVGQ